MERKYGPNLKKIRQPNTKKRKGPFSGKAGGIRREQLFKAKAEERRLKNIDFEINDLVSQYDSIDASKIAEFKDLPISVKTLQGLIDSDFTTPTEIQKQSIGLALQGCDILGAAKTGSGKTLAFLVPILECLYRHKWSNLDGMGALIISPVRELAYQTFEVLRKIGKKHDFSAGLVIGGKKLEEEAARIRRTNIVICTPGRLLQHMDETPYFDADSLQMLVLDEADRILDLGFAPTMNAIIENLPATRQTLLFSATQTKSVKDLARLSLNKPMYISVHEMAAHTTPARLQQHYMVCELHEKFNILWSFVASHLKSKIIVFLATSKQVKFMYEAFVKLRCSLTLLSLYGSMDQVRRVGNYESFCRKDHALLFATDVAARGLDFPEVHWVIQLDCPDDTNTYIHRVGRTARYKEDGQALLILLPSERESMVRQLGERKIPIDEIQVNPRRVWNQQARLDSLAAADVDIKTKAQGAFTTYLKSVYLMKDKSVFNHRVLDTDAYARSLGLAIAPRVRFIEAALKRQRRQKLDSRTFNEDDTKLRADDSVEMSHDHDDGEDGKFRESSGSGGESTTNTTTLAFDVNEDDDLFEIKPSRTSIEIDEDEDQGEIIKAKKPVTKVALAKKILKRKMTINKKTVYDNQGEIIHDRLKESGATARTGPGTGLDINEAKLFMEKEDEVDRQIYRERIKKKHKAERLKAKEERRLANRHRLQQTTGSSDDDDAGVTLATPEDVDASAGENASPDARDSWESDEGGASSDDESGSESDSEAQPSDNTRRVSSSPKKMKNTAEYEDDFSTKLSTKDVENLALQLLT